MVDINQWLLEAKEDPSAEKCGMYLTHNGVVRGTTKASVREGAVDTGVKGMIFSYDEKAVAEAVEETKKMPGIYFVRTWLNSGELSVGDDIMYVLIGGDIRPHVVDALEYLVSKLKNECVKEQEI